jgi:hypothetical protein
VFLSHELNSNKGILKKQKNKILEEELKALSVGYLEKIAEEVLPSQTVVVGVFIPIIKMEGPLKDHEVNATYIIHSERIQSQRQSFLTKK